MLTVLAMDDEILLRRAEIARRLKAARWIAGGVRPSPLGKNGKPKGKTGFEVHALSPDDLAARSPLPENEITASLIGAIERMERHSHPMELEKIARALKMPHDWFTVHRVAPVSLDFSALRDALADASELLAGLGATPPGPSTGAPDTPESADSSGEDPEAPGQEKRAAE